MFLTYDGKGRYLGEDTFLIADFNCMPHVPSSLEFHPVASCDHYQSQGFVCAGNVKRSVRYKRMRAAGGIMNSCNYVTHEYLPLLVWYHIPSKKSLSDVLADGVREKVGSVTAAGISHLFQC